MASPFTYLRFFGHVFGHLDISHLTGNLMMLLILGPMLEERYGGKILTAVIAVTALITGVASFILFPNQALMGASGVVFAFILLASFTSFKEREIPLTFILVAILYIGQQIYQGIFVDDNVSQFTHILGGITGSVLGYNLNKK
jgi:GlpG protein